jgi:glucans biosynthesis protein
MTIRMTRDFLWGGAPSRRQVLSSVSGFALSTLLFGGVDKAVAFSGITNDELGPPIPFSFESLQKEAEELAKRPFEKVVVPSPDVLFEIDYDQYQRIKYRPDKSLRLDREGHFPVQLFHLGKYATEPVRIHIVESGTAREVIYSPDLFEIPEGHPARKLSAGAGFAGFRVMADDLKTDWFAAMGASYFRTSGPYDQYGLSARGVAIDTAMPQPEEFPRFGQYWLRGPSEADGPLTIYGLLDGPSITGAYQMQTRRLTDANGIRRIVMEIEARLFARHDIDRIGIAPFSSMFWYGEATHNQPRDWRPEIHDSDGLAILTGAGERIWRPISNPPRVMTSAFVDHDVQGFGLLQRDRDFDHYLDDGIFYERRASVWVEPLDQWGDGAVQLVEIPTDDETSDNIVACWAPKEDFKAGQRRTWRYRLSWLDDIAFPDSLARAIGTWTGIGGPPGPSKDRPVGVRKFVIDFQGKAFDGLGRDDGVELIVNASRGTLSTIYNHPVVDQKQRWRAVFDIKADGTEPVDLRAFLRKGKQALTETWIYQYFPNDK